MQEPQAAADGARCAAVSWTGGKVIKLALSTRAAVQCAMLVGLQRCVGVSLLTSPFLHNPFCATSSGQDCNLALLKAWRDPSLRVVALVVFRPKQAVFKAHPLRIMEVQAASLTLSLLHVEITGEPSYKHSYVAGMRRLREEHGIEVMVTGDMDLVGTMQRNWIEEVCVARMPVRMGVQKTVRKFYACAQCHAD